jgi:hypothetical protein
MIHKRMRMMLAKYIMCPHGKAARTNLVVVEEEEGEATSPLSLGASWQYV